MKKESVYAQYNGECPDCGTKLPKALSHEESCDNCGHVFFEQAEIDVSCCDPSCELR